MTHWFCSPTSNVWHARYSLLAQTLRPKLRIAISKGKDSVIYTARLIKIVRVLPWKDREKINIDLV
jgi:hypothetical protein